MDRDVVREVLQLGGRRQLALQKEPRDLEERRLLGQLLDRVTPVFEDPLVAVDERDRRLARRRVRERRVVGHEAEVVLVGLDLAQVEGANRPVLDGQLVRLAGAVVGDRERAFSGHDFLPSRIGAFRPDSRPAPDRRDGAAAGACLECLREPPPAPPRSRHARLGGRPLRPRGQRARVARAQARARRGLSECADRAGGEDRGILLLLPSPVPPALPILLTLKRRHRPKFLRR